jgi:hypothetical protein
VAVLAPPGEEVAHALIEVLVNVAELRTLHRRRDACSGELLREKGTQRAIGLEICRRLSLAPTK